VSPLSVSDDALVAATRLLESTAETSGYAIWYGVGDGELLKAVASSSELQIVGVDPREPAIQRLRREVDRAGWYGTRIALHRGDPESFAAPAYMAHLIVVQEPLGERLQDPDCLARVFASLRPYGGRLWIPVAEGAEQEFADRLTTDALEGSRMQTVPGAVIVSREGALPGSADWTHAYGDIANTVKSDDRRVRLPLGLLWFGGSSNLDVLPRHGHGPSEQVIGGRLFIEGMNCLSARDVYTGRVLWKRDFEDLGTFQIYYDETYEDTPLSTIYNQVHIPGANARGTNYVATAEGVYLVIRDRCLLLDAATGQTLREFVLPEDADGTPPSWGFLGVYQNLLLAGVNFANYSQRLGYRYKSQGKKGPAWSPDHEASLGLLAFDRQSGQILWRLEAVHSFLHNGIVAGGDRVYLLDKLPRRVEEQDARRGTDGGPTDYRILAVEAHSGKPIWTRGNASGTWLSYSRGHDLLVHAGAASTDRSPDEVDTGLAVLNAANGSVLWEQPELKYVGPCILHGDTIITNSKSYQDSVGAYRLLDGQPVRIPDPVTGEWRPWKFLRNYGCSTAVASEHLLTFRTGAAGFYDLANHGGTGNFGGFKSGCTSNLIIGNGVLNAPDFTRTCSCGYQNQTSLALVPMPENEVWTFNLFAREGPQPPRVRRVGINLGAPGDRLSDGGTLWVNHPADEGASPAIPVSVSGNVEWFCGHSGRVSGEDLPWVAASGVEGIEHLTVRVGPTADTAATPAESRRFSIRLYFLEPRLDTQPGERVFDVAVAGQTVIRDLDVVRATGGPLRTLVRQVPEVLASGVVEFTFTSQGPRRPVLSGVEIMETSSVGLPAFNGNPGPHASSVP
jgi:outer membrane protein assembly factor BamB